MSMYPWLMSFGCLPPSCSLCSRPLLGVSPSASSGLRPVTGHFSLWRASGTGGIKPEDTERCLLLSTILQGQNRQSTRENVLNMYVLYTCAHIHTHTHLQTTSSLVVAFLLGSGSGESRLLSASLVSIAQ